MKGFRKKGSIISSDRRISSM